MLINEILDRRPSTSRIRRPKPVIQPEPEPEDTRKVEHLPGIEVMVWDVDENGMHSIKDIMPFNFGVSLPEVKDTIHDWYPNEKYVTYKQYRPGIGWKIVDGYVPPKVSMNEGHDGDEHFELKDISDVHNDKSRETLVYMSPTDFLSMAKEGHDPDKFRNIIDLVKRGAKFNSTPLLSFTHDGKGLAVVIGHEGRHRARVLQALGVKEMPVILKSIGSNEGYAIRWGSQHRPMDKVPVMPTKLRGEDGRTTIPMPKSVIFP